MKKYLLPLLFSSTYAVAGPFVTADARSMAMGDVGVAASAPGTAALYNPALLSSYSEDNNKFSLVLPNVGVSAYADEDTIDSFNDIDDNDYLTRIADAVDGINTAINASNEGNFDNYKSLFASSTNEFNSKLDAISGEPLNINANAMFALSRQNKGLGVSVYASSNAVVESSLAISPCDTGLLSAIANTVAGADQIADLTGSTDSYTCAATGTTIDFIDSGELISPDDKLISAVEFALVATSEVGVSLSHAFNLHGREVSIGITPKVLTVTTQYARPSLQQIDDDQYDLGDELEAHEEEYSDMNLDIGVATKLLDSLTVGVVVKNLIGQSYDTALYTTTFDSAPSEINKQTIDIDPQIRAGLAWQAGGLTVAADLDITENKGYLAGNDSQYMAAGLEYNAFNTLRLRAGMRSNLSDSDDTAFSAGVGLNIVAAHIDLGLISSSNNAGASLQFGVEF